MTTAYHHISHLRAAIALGLGWGLALAPVPLTATPVSAAVRTTSTSTPHSSTTQTTAVLQVASDAPALAPITPPRGPQQWPLTPAAAHRGQAAHAGPTRAAPPAGQARLPATGNAVRGLAAGGLLAAICALGLMRRRKERSDACH